MRILAIAFIFLIWSSSCFAESPVVLQTLLMEARGEGIIGMQAVGEVIRNRSKHSGDSFKDECLKRKQFSCWNNKGDAMLKIAKFGVNDYKIAEQAWRLSKNSNITRGANLYANLSLCSPSWVRSNKVKKTVKILHHTFFKE